MNNSSIFLGEKVSQTMKNLLWCDVYSAWEGYIYTSRCSISMDVPVHRSQSSRSSLVLLVTTRHDIKVLPETFETKRIPILYNVCKKLKYIYSFRWNSKHMYGSVRTFSTENTLLPISFFIFVSYKVKLRQILLLVQHLISQMRFPSTQTVDYSQRWVVLPEVFCQWKPLGVRLAASGYGADVLDPGVTNHVVFECFRTGELSSANAAWVLLFLMYLEKYIYIVYMNTRIYTYIRIYEYSTYTKYIHEVYN